MSGVANVLYHYESGSWWIESPEYPGYVAFGDSRASVSELARLGLPLFAEAPELLVLGLLDSPGGITSGAA